MVDVKTCLDNAQEKMDRGHMYLEEALAHIRATTRPDERRDHKLFFE